MRGKKVEAKFKVKNGQARFEVKRGKKKVFPRVLVALL